MGNKYSVIISRRADEMLVSHTRFLAQVSPGAARKMICGFQEVVERLETSPFQFPVEEDYNLPPGVYRKALFGKWYKAVFQVRGDCVYLDAVLDCRQRNSNLFRG